MGVGRGVGAKVGVGVAGVGAANTGASPIGEGLETRGTKGGTNGTLFCARAMCGDEAIAKSNAQRRKRKERSIKTTSEITKK